MGSAIPPYAYATFITRSSYLAGVTLLAFSLRKHGSNYPLVVLYTPALPASSIRALELEARHTNIIPCPVDLLTLPNNQKTTLIAARFADTWTKLRVFSSPLFKYDKVCYLDADMMIFNQNMDSVFDFAVLPGSDWLAATQVCCCNCDRDSWAPRDWTAQNCAYTGLRHPEALKSAKPVPKKGEGNARHADLNGGMFVFRPSAELWDRMITYFETCDHLSSFKFPDQDFLAEFFEDRWVSMPWQFNALKTHRYWHEGLWRDEEVVCLHYIVDKPWAKRIAEDGVAGYKGRDGDTHSWWWREYEKWKGEREGEVLEIVGRCVARPLDEEGGMEDEDMKDIGSGVQALAKNGTVDGHAKMKTKTNRDAKQV